MKINIEKPEYPLRTSYKLVSGVLSLLLGVLSAFVFIEVRNRGLAIIIFIPTVIIFIPTVICFMWYMYSLYKDNISLLKYKRYAKNLHEILKTRNIGYRINTHFYGEAKNVVSILILIFLITSVASTIQKEKYVSGIVFFLTILSLGGYGYAVLDYLEREEVERDILEMETKLAEIPQ